jgi:hypothetical protein
MEVRNVFLKTHNLAKTQWSPPQGANRQRRAAPLDLDVRESATSGNEYVGGARSTANKSPDQTNLACS